MRWAGHVAWEDEICLQIFGRETSGEEDYLYLRELGVDGRIILKWNLVAGFYERGNELLGFMKTEHLDQLLRLHGRSLH
jgi:hypothetical protein